MTDVNDRDDRRDLRGPAHRRPRHHRDAGLPRRQRLVLRQGDPPRRRPRRRSRSTPPTPSRASPSTCSRRCPACASTPAPAVVAAASWSGSTRAPGSATSPSTSRSPSSRSSATTSGAARPAQVKGEKGRYNIIYGYVDEQVGLEAGRLAVRLVNHLVEADPDFDFERGARRLHPARPAHRVRPLDAGDHRRGRLARHPVDPAQPSTRSCSSARASTPSGSAPR